MNVCFQFGPLYVATETPVDFPWTPEAEVFRIDSIPVGCDSVFYQVEFVDTFEPLPGRILHSDWQMMVMEAEGQENRIFFLPTNGEPFALSQRMDETHVRIFIDRRAQQALKWDRTLLGLFSLEHDLVRCGGFLLHASWVIQDGEAMVFTAPSGTGKSTQADLWAEHAGAQIVNGDRTLLYLQDGQWVAGGFPVCGSSEYCLNRSAPLRAVVSLEQAPENQAHSMGPGEALHRVYSQSFVNRWNADDCSRICDMVLDLAQRNMVYHYRCTKEPDAVTCLQQAVYPT